MDTYVFEHDSNWIFKAKTETQTHTEESLLSTKDEQFCHFVIISKNTDHLIRFTRSKRPVI